LLDCHREERQRISAGEGIDEIIDEGGLENLAIGLWRDLRRAANDVAIG